MKKIVALVSLVLVTRLTQAQRFFYIDNNHITEKLLNDGLTNASQYVTKSPMGSDYIIKTDVDFQSGSNVLTLKIMLQDSLTFKTIFQADEEYSLCTLQANPRIFVSMAIRTFIEKNMNQIILCAKDDHCGAQMKWLKPRKDKT
jgi:hypothetical protein